MNVRSLKVWHWALVGLAIGLTFSFYRGWVGSEGSLVERTTIDSTEFEQLLVKKTPSGQPLLTDIRYVGQEDATDWVVARQWVRKGKGSSATEGYEPVKIAFDRPYHPRLNRPSSAGANATVIDYLRDIRGKNPEVRFSTNWWDREPVRSPLFALIGMVLVAGIFPFVLHRFSDGASTHPPNRAGAEYDLSRFGKGRPEPGKKMPSGPTEADMTQLRELEAELEKGLAAQGKLVAPGIQPASINSAPAPSQTQPPTSQQQQTQPQQSQPPRKLDAGPLDQPADNSSDKTNKQFAGEFYPTETHVRPDKKKT